MIETVSGSTDAQGLHIGIAAALWNQSITDRLLDGALSRCEELGADRVTVVRAPGSLELPLLCQKLAEAGCDAVVAIGVIVKGETDHYELVAADSSRGISEVALTTGVPIGNAVLAVHDVAQALDRAGTGSTNKGFEAVDAAVSVANSIARLPVD